MLDSPAPIDVAADARATGSARGRCGPSLRERKKIQTRARIIEVALNLCDSQGFEATTVEQIAHAADVSPRTVNRYFETKEDIILGPISDFGEGVAVALRQQPRADSDLRALCNAYLAIIDSAANGGDVTSFRQFQQMQRIARNSPAVNARALEFGETKTTAITRCLAERTGDAPGALRVRLVVATWQMLCHIAMADSEELVVNSDPQTAARAARAAVLTAYNELQRICSQSRPLESA
ncbi:TetR/AcrR family transcriptional regulator [Nocardia noduli]|uniref:TetR/AcrR family transcriptional regulator n=1 Tax=Nocardia noduli TaxID=2815722 RepID=UPI001C2120C0|nr:TetR family transcriptional regulator [Nocardia noduli]